MTNEQFENAFDKLYEKFKNDKDKFKKSAKAAQYLRSLADYIDKQTIKVDPNLVQDLWNKKMVKLGFSPAVKLDSSSVVYKNIKQRSIKIVKQFGVSDDEVLGFFDSYFDKIADSKYLSGKVNDFKANFIWVMLPNNYDKIINGSYDNKKQ